MPAPTQSKCGYRFGLFELDLARRKLLRKGEPVRMQELPFRFLTILLERAGEVVTREELRQSLWPEGTYVEFDGSLNAALKKLRFALGDDADNPIFIETVPKRGYRFIAPVECERPSERADAGVTEPPSPVLQIPSGRPSPGSRFKWHLLWIMAGAAVLFLAAGWKYAWRSRSGPPTPARKVIAVLPFANEGAGPDFDYLRYAIANDLVTDLTYVPSVTVRPFASTNRYATEPADPATVGKELRVTHILAGGFLLDGQHLQVNLELVDVARDQPVWRGEARVSPQELVALHDQLASRTTREMLLAMNILDTSTSKIPVPRNAQAFELFLHSLSFPLDPEPNRLAIRKLEESVAMDGSYAPAWAELGWRYYVNYHYGDSGTDSVTKALQAYKRQSELDPDVPSVPTIIRVEQGDLNGAYDQAMEFLGRRPDLSTAHFGLSYVFRYAGLLEEAGAQCDAALTLDPGFNGLRSCANPFIQKGDYAHAAKYISLDATFSYSRLTVQLRTRNTAAILPELARAAQSGFHEADVQLALLRACLDHAPKAELSQAVAKLQADPVLERDAEPSYMHAEFLAFCGQADGALRQLARAIRGKYCSYPAMDNDPLFDSIRSRPEFAELRQMGIQCQQSFLDHRAQVGPPLQADRP